MTYIFFGDKEARRGGGDVTAPTPQGRNDRQKYGAVMTNHSLTTQSLCGRIRICSAAACFGRIVT
jgi:hypothetical protein